MNVQESLPNDRIVSDDLLKSIESGGSPLESIGIDAINLSRRSYNALRRNGIDTIHKLIHLSERDLFRIRNIGDTCVQEIEAKVKNYANNILGTVENADITSMSLLSYLETRGTKVTQPRLTVNDIPNDIVQLEVVPLSRMPLPGELVNHLLSLGLTSSLDLWVLAFGHYINVHSDFYRLLQDVSKDIIGPWIVQQKDAFSSLVEINSQQLSIDNSKKQNVYIPQEHLDSRQLVITLSLRVSEASTIFWEAILPFPRFLQDLTLDIKDNMVRGFCLYFLDLARSGTVKHWGTSSTISWNSLPIIRPTAILSNWINSIKGANIQRNIDIFKERYGLVSGHKKALEELGTRNNLTRERVRQITERILSKLRHPSRQRMLSPFNSYFDTLFRKYGYVMTLKEIAYNSKFTDELVDFFPLTTVELILNFCKKVSTLDYSYEKNRLDVLELGWVTFYLQNEVDPDDIRRVRNIAIDLVTENPYRYDSDELVKITSAISGLPAEIIQASIRTCKDLQQNTQGYSKRNHEEGNLTITQMAVIALKELMVPAHHKVIYRKMQELFPGAKVDTGSFNNVLSNRLFQWVDRGTYGLAEWNLPKVKPKKVYEANKQALVTFFNNIGRPAYISEINKYLETIKQEDPDYKQLSTTQVILQSNPHLFARYGGGKWGLAR